MKSTRLITQSLCAVLVLTLAGGCQTVKTVNQTSLPAGQLLPHHAALVLTPEFSNYTPKLPIAMALRDVYPMGSDLQDYARNVTAKSFQQIDVVPSGERAAALVSNDLILIPRAVKADNSFSGLGFPPNYTITLVIEWTVKNRATQNIVWLKTITANATGGANHVQVLFQKLIDDLSLKTYKAFQEAPELRGSQP